jgi:hypothetical protein
MPLDNALEVHEKPFPYKLYYTPVDEKHTWAILQFYAAGYHCSAIDNTPQLNHSKLQVWFSGIKNTNEPAQELEVKSEFPPSASNKKAVFTTIQGYIIKDVDEVKYADGICTVKFLIEQLYSNMLVEWLQMTALDFVKRTKLLMDDPKQCSILKKSPEDWYRARMIGFLLPRQSGKTTCAFEIYKHLEKVILVTRKTQQKMTIMYRFGNCRALTTTWDELCDLNHPRSSRDGVVVFDMDQFSLEDTLKLLEMMDLYERYCFIFVGNIPDINAAITHKEKKLSEKNDAANSNPTDTSKEKPHSIVYLATPYGHHDQQVVLHRVETVNRVAAKLMRDGQLVVSPVSYLHPISLAGDLPTDWTYWKTYCKALLSTCSKLIVLKQNGWKESAGVIGEIAIANELGISVEYLDAYE